MRNIQKWPEHDPNYEVLKIPLLTVALAFDEDIEHQLKSSLPAVVHSEANIRRNTGLHATLNWTYAPSLSLEGAQRYLQLMAGYFSQMPAVNIKFTEYQGPDYAPYAGFNMDSNGIIEKMHWQVLHMLDACRDRPHIQRPDYGGAFNDDLKQFNWDHFGNPSVGELFRAHMNFLLGENMESVAGLHVEPPAGEYTLTSARVSLSQNKTWHIIEPLLDIKLGEAIES